MILDLFLIDLMQSGQVSVPHEMVKFEHDASKDTVILLESYHRSDSLEMPGIAPNFHAGAAIWAAKYIFTTIQLLLLRNIEVAEIDLYLKDYDGEKSSEASYSADLTLRFLPDLLKFGSGLSPADPLIAKLKSTAEKWPFSSVGIEGLTSQADENILAHPSLRVAYIDRIIQKKDVTRLQHTNEKNLLKEVLGIHQAKLWPDLSLILNEETT